MNNLEPSASAMDGSNIRQITAAHIDALVQIDHAIIAAQAMGLGALPPSIAQDVNQLRAIHSRVKDRVQALVECTAAPV